MAVMVQSCNLAVLCSSQRPLISTCILKTISLPANYSENLNKMLVSCYLSKEAQSKVITDFYVKLNLALLLLWES